MTNREDASDGSETEHIYVNGVAQTLSVTIFRTQSAHPPPIHPWNENEASLPLNPFQQEQRLTQKPY